MTESRKSNSHLVAENQRLRAQIAQLEDKLDHIYEHGATAKALQQFEAMHREVMASVADVVLVTDETGRLTYVSPNAHLIFGHSSAEILKQGRIANVLPADLFIEDLLEQRGELSNIECQIRDSVGRARHILVTVRRVDLCRGKILYACRDVTERKAIQLDYDLLKMTLEKRVEAETQTLRESRDRYRRMVEGLRDEYLFFGADRDGTITYVSPSVFTILGRTPAEAIGHNWREFIDPNSPTLAQLEKLEQMRFSGVETPPYRSAIPHVNGEMRMLEFRDIPVHDANGRVIANEGIGKDITARYLAEEALRKAHEELERRVAERTAELSAKNEQLRHSQEQYRSIIQDHLEFIVRWREDGIRTFVNDSYCNHFATTADELLGRNFLHSILEDDRQELLKKLDRVSVDKPVVVHDHRIVLPDGRVGWEHWTHRALFSSEGKLLEYQSVGCDVTERRKREEQAEERAAAMSRIGALTTREFDVMRLVVAGDANKVVARKLGLSIKTIEKHRSSLMKKLEVRSVPELVRFALLIEGSTTA